MGYQLYRQVRDFAPQNWTSGELVTALMIADSANDGTRRSYLDAAELSRRARMSERGVRKALERLAERGFEFRVCKSKDKDGKTLYAVNGKQVEYQVPDIFMLLARGAAIAYGLVDNPVSGGTAVPAQGGLSTDRGGTAVPPSRYHSTGSGRAALFSLGLKPAKPPQLDTGNCPHTYSWNRARERRRIAEKEKPGLSGPIAVASKLPDGDGNGLGVIYGTLIRRPHKCHVVIAIVDCSKVTTNSDSGEIKPTARLRRIEVVAEDDLLIAEQLLSRAVDARLGHEQLPFDLEADIHAAFKDAHMGGEREP